MIYYDAAFLLVDMIRSVCIVAVDAWLWATKWAASEAAIVEPEADDSILPCQCCGNIWPAVASVEVSTSSEQEKSPATEDEPDEVVSILYKKGDQRFVFVFRDDQRWEVMNAATRMATNPDIDFNFYDVAILKMQVKPCSTAGDADGTFDFDDVYRRFTQRATDAPDDDI